MQDTETHRDTAAWLVPIVFFIIVVFSFPLWLHHIEADDDETETWLRDVLHAHQDPWMRYSQLEGGFERDMSIAQRRRLAAHRDQALEQALAAQTPAAFDIIETNKVYDQLSDKYPRNASRRQQQLNALSTVWPDIGTRSHSSA